MKISLPPNYPHGDLLEEYAFNQTAEEKLSWLMERATLHDQIPEGELSPERRVPGCASGLWLTGELLDGRVSFNARSESSMVQGVACFLCELCSGISPSEAVSLTPQLATQLGLEGLLSTTRKRAVHSTLAFITNFAAGSGAR